MKRREFIQAAPLTLAILPSPSRDVPAMPDVVFENELRRRFENAPDFLKREGVTLHFADAALILSWPDLKEWSLE